MAFGPPQSSFIVPPYMGWAMLPSPIRMVRQCWCPHCVLSSKRLHEEMLFFVCYELEGNSLFGSVSSSPRLLWLKVHENVFSLQRKHWEYGGSIGGERTHRTEEPCHCGLSFSGRWAMPHAVWTSRLVKDSGLYILSTAPSSSLAWGVSKRFYLEYQHCGVQSNCTYFLSWTEVR